MVMALPDLSNQLIPVKHLREIVFECELYFCDGGAPAVPEILPVAILKFNSAHHIFYGIIHQVCCSVIPFFKGIVSLCIRVSDINHRPSNGCTEFLIPVMIYKGGNTCAG